MEIVATFDSIINANIAMGRLQAEGIRCWLADEHIIQADMLYSPAIGGIKLQVDNCDAEIARKILATDYSDFDFPED
ncbi:MAG TPA: hypothetical protein ENI65_00500 [Gammaproteobacteria bacterium]|nr:hypothetical protein [Gammaproteobacteria bacterium]